MLEHRPERLGLIVHYVWGTENAVVDLSRALGRTHYGFKNRRKTYVYDVKAVQSTACAPEAAASARTVPVEQAVDLCPLGHAGSPFH